MPVPFFIGVARIALLAIFWICFFASWWALWRIGNRKNDVRARYGFWTIDPRASIELLLSRETLVFVIIWTIGACSLWGFNALWK
jgi:hypothetical protein